jgi:threonine synthase
VTDAEILAAYQRLSSEAGVFCEPASAAPVAGLLRLAREKKKEFGGQTLVAVLTGHGLKDPQAAIDAAGAISAPIADDTKALEAALQ